MPRRRLKRTTRKPRLRLALTRRDVGMLLIGAILAIAGLKVLGTLQRDPTPLSANATTKLTIDWLPPKVKRWEPFITEMGKKYNLDPNVIAIIMTIESGGNPQAVSKANAQGLMQVMPYTAKDIAAKHLKQPATSYDLLDPRTNIEFGTAYLAYLRNTYGGAQQGPSWEETVRLISAGYNGGPAAAIRLQKAQPLQYQETIHYSQKAVRLWQERHQATADLS